MATPSATSVPRTPPGEARASHLALPWARGLLSLAGQTQRLWEVAVSLLL